MRSSAGKSDQAIDPIMEFLHLLDWRSVCFGTLHESVHLYDELRRRQNGLLRFNVKRPDLRFKVSESCEL